MINRVVLVGRLTKDIDIRKTQTGVSVASFTIACNRRFQGQGQERQADFINCVAWRQTADFLGQYARKGALVGVEGRIQTRNYDGPDGRKVYVTEVVCDSAQLLESRSVSENRQQSMGQPYGNPTYGNNSYNNGGYGMPSYDNFGAPSQEPEASFDDFQAGPSLDISSDDLPF